MIAGMTTHVSSAAKGLAKQECAEVTRNAAAKGACFITPFEAAHDPTLRMATRHCNELLGDPPIVSLCPAQTSKGVISVRIKTG